MNYRDYHIEGSEEFILIPRRSLTGRDQNDGRFAYNVVVEKCEIVNTHTSKITVDVFIEKVFDRESDTLYGKEDNNPDRELVRDIYYKIKSLVIPTGAAFDIFHGRPFEYSGLNNFKIKLSTSLETADVCLKYNTYNSADRVNNNINQY